jgi:protein-L-isoaspartate(D-aspartate) O-methyltransferase
MVRDQIERRGVRDPVVLDAMMRVPRHLFVPEELRGRAYEDAPLPIGQGQTISQPYIVAFMTEAIRPQPTDRVLEIGTGSGYQAAVLALVAREVISIEILPKLGESARARLRELGYGNVTVRIGDGYAGCPEEAPFDAIIVTAAPKEMPELLLEQLKVGGRLVIPVGAEEQHLLRLTRTDEGFEREDLLPVRFVPMTGGTKSSD